MKNSIKSLFVTALMLPAFGVFSSAFAYEMVEAETVFPKAKDNQNAPQLSAGVEKKEFTIPNPLDELTLRRIREAEKANLAVQPAEKKSDIMDDGCISVFFLFVRMPKPGQWDMCCKRRYGGV